MMVEPRVYATTKGCQMHAELPLNGQKAQQTKVADFGRNGLQQKFNYQPKPFLVQVTPQ